MKTINLNRTIREPLTLNRALASTAMRALLMALLVAAGAWPALSQSSLVYAWTNFVGQAGTSGSADGTGNVAQFAYPPVAAVDSAGNLFVADSQNHTIRQVTPAGLVTTLAGLAGNPGYVDDTGSAARFNYPTGVAVDSAGNVFVADSGNNIVRKVTAAGVVTTLAGNPGVWGSADGTGNAAEFGYLQRLAVDSMDNVFVVDWDHSTIRKVTSSGVVTTLAGSPGNPGSVDGTGSAARFSYPDGVAVDSAGNLFVADSGNHTIRKVTPAGAVTTLAGSPGNPGSADGTASASRFSGPQGVGVDRAGNVFVADTGNQTIRMLTSAGMVTTIGGVAGVAGGADGVGSAAGFSTPTGVAVDGAGTLYVADYNNSRITKGTPPLAIAARPTAGGTITISGAGVPGNVCQIQATFSLNPASWSTIADKVLDQSGLFSFVDADAHLYPMRFYRPIQTLAPPPAPVTDLAAHTVSSTEVALSWVNNSDTVGSVTVEYGTSQSGPFQAVATLPPTLTSYTVGSLSPQTQYYFRVKESNAYGDSPYSAIVTATTAASPIATSPTGTDLQISPAMASASRMTALMPNPNGVTLGNPRLGMTSTLLQDYSVLVLGGVPIIPNAELFDPSANNGAGQATSMTGHLNSNPFFHTATLLSNGKVLVAGGHHLAGPSIIVVSKVESFDRYANGGHGVSTSLTPLNSPRHYHTATLLPSGKITIVGGADSVGLVSNIELYDPTGAGSTQNFGTPLAVDYHTATLLPSGKVLIIGGQVNNGTLVPSSAVYLFDPAGNGGAGSLTQITSLAAARYSHTATLLANGTILIVGGNSGTPGVSAPVEIYDPNGVTGATPGATQTLRRDLGTPRYGHTANLLPDGRVLIAGGVDISSSAPTSSVEIYNPQGLGSAVPFGDLAVAVANHASVTLPDGRVWIAGGSDSSGNPQAYWDTYSPFTPVQLSLTGGNAPYAFSAIMGSASTAYQWPPYYRTPAGALCIPTASGTIQVRATDADGTYVDSVIQAQ